MSKTILALDIGTSSVRAGIYTCSKDPLPLATVKKERNLTVTQDGGYEIDPIKAYDQTVFAIDELLRIAPETQVVRVGISSFWHSLMGIDHEGNPTTKVFAWGETRPADFVETLRDSLDEIDCHNRTGCRFHSSYWTAKLLWQKKDYPDIFEATAYWISFSDFFALKTHNSDGKLLTSVSMASGTGIFDIHKNTWDRELCDFIGVQESQLPIIAEDEASFALKPEFAERWKSLEKARWHLAIGDGSANNIGAGCCKKEKAAIMIGTSGAMRVAYVGNPPKKIPAGLWCYRIDRKMIIIGGALSDGGGLYSWLKENFRMNRDDDKTEEIIAERAPFQHGITFLPFLAGERSTGFHEHAQGSIVGLHIAHTSIDIVQAALESVAFRFASVFDQLNEVVDTKEIIASGGALRESPIWTQILADVLGRNLELPEIKEVTSIGAARFVAKSEGAIRDLSEVEHPDGVKFSFRKDRFEKYREARKTHESYYKMLITPLK